MQICFCACDSTVDEGSSLHISSDSLIAHRGSWFINKHPENSVAAFREALNMKLYGTEFDVRQTKDEQLVICHNDIYAGKVIEDYPYDELNVSKLMNGEDLPRLEDFLLIYKNTETDVKLIIDLKKCKINKVLHLVDSFDVQDQVEYITFSTGYCRQLANKGYGSKTFYLGGNYSPLGVKDSLGCYGISYSHKIFDKNPDWIEEAKVLGMRIGVWTVNSKESISDYLQKGVVVTTDIPIGHS